MAQVTLRKIVKKYDDTEAVRGIDLDIADKEFVVLVGPSGCGKSTTLRMIAGLEEITGGEIAVDGEIVNDVPPKDRDMAMVFQNYALYPHMTVYQNMSFGLRLKHFPKPEIEKRVQEAARILDITELLDRKPRQLSGGQQQRVALGRCIVRNPRVFLFDEPLSNLDAKLRTQMRLEIKLLRSRVPTTSVLVTHDQVEAMTLGDRVVVMLDGRIQQAGTPLEVYGNPANKFVAGFIGAPSMNFLNVKISEQDGMLFAETPLLRLALPEARNRALAGWRDKNVIMGARPEHLSIGNHISRCCFDSRVEVIEQLGSEIILETRVGEDRVTVARVDPQAHLAIGETVALSVQAERLHFFDPVTEAVIAK